VNSPIRQDFFFDAYDRDDVAYGLQPSAALAEFLKQAGGGSGRALDLGAGAGRDTLALAAAGYLVTSVDMSQRGGQRIAERAAQAGLGESVEVVVGDVREIDYPAGGYDAIIATTVLDHLPAADAVEVWQRMCDALGPHGVLYVQVHTTEDPGSDQPPGDRSEAPVSETAAAVVNYFRPNQLVGWAADPASRLRVLRYEERLEWDYTHGPEHQHGKAVLLAVREGFYPEWYGQPPAFPRQQGG